MRNGEVTREIYLVRSSCNSAQQSDIGPSMINVGTQEFADLIGVFRNLLAFIEDRNQSTREGALRHHSSPKLTLVKA